ncbi:YkgJ family cysteine cluster protein [Pontibacillus salicampi]|uniref:YkgJ family cysteine cluster protein n=1 Tax=Pontibacillus salicampi TaxID=1449801 RepID=A0ABV6LMR2_9BACI
MADSYLTYEEILKKIELINDQYEINEEYFGTIVDQLLSSNLSGDEIIKEGFQQMLEQVNKEMEKMESFMDVKATCFMGCAFCCYFPIIITGMEAKSITRIIETWPEERREKIVQHLRNYFQTYEKEVEQVTSIDRENDPNFKQKYIAAQVPCPFLNLETNTCMAYEVRPIPCRTYVNYADPEVCATNHMPKETISYEFLYDFYIGALNEILQELYEGGEETYVDYPSDLWSYDYLANWLKDWVQEENTTAY